MLWLIILFTLILILDCLFLTLLILVQLPKKEAGLGQAFGSSATDALFGAGSGNALTKMTKYATAVFLVLTLSLSILNAHNKNKPSSLQQNIQKLKSTSPMPSLPATEPIPTNISTGTPKAEAPAPATPSPSTATTPAPVTPSPSTTGTNAK